MLQLSSLEIGSVLGTRIISYTVWYCVDEFVPSLAGGHPIGSDSVYVDAVDDPSLEAGGFRGLSCRASLSKLILTSLILMPVAGLSGIAVRLDFTRLV